MGISPLTMGQFTTGIDLAEQPTSKVTPDTVMFGVDFPHFESITFETTTHVKELLEHPAVDEGLARQILYGKAAELYGFDLDLLEPHMERIGFDARGELAAMG
jgi:predicted TIM-barrel fold metal-dependent hydrolase